MAYASPAGGSVTREATLADLGLSDPVQLSYRNFEQHFYFPVPQGVALKNARLEIHGSYLHPFQEAAAVSVLVNGVPLFAHRLSGGQGGFSLKMVDLEGATFSRGRADEEGEAIDIALPLRKLRAVGGFVDIGVVLSSQVDATRCIDERGRGNELSIDPAATRMVYSFDGGEVRDVRSMLTTLPRHPVILLPGAQIDAAHYAAALRVAQALSGMGLQPEFAAVPKIGDVVDTAGLADAADTSGLHLSRAMADSVAQGRAYKIATAGDVAAWLALRMLSADGLAQVVVDAAQTRQALLSALQQDGGALSNGLKRRLQLDGAAAWLQPAQLDNANVRVAMQAGQPVLAMDGAKLDKAADLIATLWHEIAGSRELALDEALHLADQDSQVPHVHFAPNLPVLNVAATSEWVVPIRLGNLPQGKWPGSFELNLMAAPSGDGLAPVVSVFMNDNLLTATTLRTDGKISRLHAQIPMYAMRADNQLRVEIRRRIAGGHCTGMAQGFPVQLLPSSYLNLRDAPEPTQFYMLGAEFGRDGEVVIPAHYLDDAANTLGVVGAVLRGLSIGAQEFKLVTDARPGFRPDRAFVSFETQPRVSTEHVVVNNGRLVVRNRRDHKVFDSAGLGELAVLQLQRSGSRYGVSVIATGAALPALRKPPQLSAGNFAVADAAAVRLAVNLDDPENDWQLDEQNRGVLTFMQRYRTWFIVLGVLLLPVLLVLGLRWYYRNKQVQG